MEPDVPARGRGVPREGAGVPRRAPARPTGRASAALDRDEVADVHHRRGGPRSRQHGYLAPSWPQDYGGAGLTALEQVILAEEFQRAGVPTGGTNDVFGIQMVGNTILQWGTEEQKRHFLPRILSGEDIWCQGYSEPNAGSDLGNLGCRAVLDGDEWVINGQKIWTSRRPPGQLDLRADPHRPRRRRSTRASRSCSCPMDQPGRRGAARSR